MERKVYQKLIQWKADNQRKPLILEGARQVGKTWLMLEFAKREYANYVYVNFDKDKWAQSLFVQDFDIARILLQLEAQSSVHIEKERTLIILDEIQEAQRGLGVLKYFQEEAPEYHVIVAGSLLGITIHQQQSFPVGKVDIIRVEPMSFIEFLYAMGEDKKAECIERKQWNILAALAVKYVDLLRQYYFVGGMPEVVASFVSHRNLQEVRRLQTAILTGYRNDISKHTTPSDAQRIGMVLQSLPAQLSKDNKKFIYGVMRKGARAREFEVAIQWLADAGIVRKVYRVSEPRMPLSFYEDLEAFKLYMLDGGLLACLADVPASQILSNDNIFQEWKGAFTEQYVLQQLALTGKHIGYWVSNRSDCEIDFLVQNDECITPIEVKAETNVYGKSFKHFITDLYPHLRGIRYSMKPYIEQDWFTNIPLYAIL